jgi:hypothetical protein
LPATPAAAAAPATDSNLTDMAHQLEVALRRPPAGEPRVDIPAAERHPVEPVIGPPTTVANTSRHNGAQPLEAELTAPEIRPVAADSRPPESKKFYETLEQEMASLLGRPTGKT